VLSLTTQRVRRALLASSALLVLCSSAGYAEDHDGDSRSVKTRTPIKHLVVIYQENNTFDHYFATYPNAANIPGETSWIGVPASEFHARPGTPAVNGLTPSLLTQNPNASLTGSQANPQRLRPMDAFTCDMNHGYTAEQNAIDMGLMDHFVQKTGSTGEGCQLDGSTVMNYYDGNTVTALWNYAQHYSMSDNSFDTNYGPTFPGHLNLISGNTHGAILRGAATTGGVYTSPVDGSLTIIGNTPAYLDDCGGAVTVEMTGKNVGDLLNAKSVTWGWFNGGFAPTQPAVLNPDGATNTKAVCGQTHTNHQFTLDGTTYVVPNPTTNFTKDVHTPGADWYTAGVEPFMYYASTRNPHHLPPSSVTAIGKTDQANHQYDSADFFAALKANNLPAVSFLKAPAYAWGHPGNSDALVEQAWVVQSINAIMTSPEWESTAIIIAWDDPDGWYDHVVPPVVQPSNTALDFHCGNGNPAPGDSYARCGLGQRQPLLVISPWAKTNYVDHAVTEQASILAFIEKNWDLGYIDGPIAPPAGTGSVDRYAGSIEGMFDFDRRPNMRPLILDPIKGTVVSGGRADLND
jgi:phospholipase C